MINEEHRLENLEPEPDEPRLKNLIAWAWAWACKLEKALEPNLEPRLSLSLCSSLLMINCL